MSIEDGTAIAAAPDDHLPSAGVARSAVGFLHVIRPPDLSQLVGVGNAVRLTGSSRTGWPDADCQAGGKAEASTNGREAATSARQAVVSVGTGKG